MNNINNHKACIKVLIGLGNPGKKYEKTRHNIGFLLIDYIAQLYQGVFKLHHNMLTATVTLDSQPLLLIKPQTFMNNAGDIIPFLAKQGIKAENILVIHDELDLPFGKLKIKYGGSARGHNGLKSIIAHAGDTFIRLSIGIGRPNNQKDVPEYVLQEFTENNELIQQIMVDAYAMTEKIITSNS